MRVLIVDDEEFVRLVLTEALRAEDCEVTAVSTGQAGIECLQTGTFDCVISDLRMPGTDGRAVLAWVQQHVPDVDVVMLTGHGDVKDAVEAIKQGAADFLIKDTPFDGTVVRAAIAKLRTVRKLRRENLAARHGGFRQDIIVEGPSKAWQDLRAQIVRVAPSHAPILIQGETGSGKEIVARLLHELSARSDGPFIAVNCGAVSRELLESELFGHEKGSFTGATTSKPGLIAAAQGGTLFLDELGEMPPAMQVSLLRVLDRGEYRPVGSTRTLHADVRIVGATNQDLRQAVSEGRFREDLLYRINTVPLLVPPLRERTEDLAPLVDHILQNVRVPGTRTRTLTPEALRYLTTYRWPGNIRELRNTIERLVLISPDQAPIGRDEVASALPATPASMAPEAAAHLTLDEVAHRHIERVLAVCGGNKTKAAQMLDIDYKTLLTKIKQSRPG
jgi:DNA-binding NtrC family response regulator